ncbi:MAG: hypothetical protein C0425_02755 [Chlorobiaceae bacterium]|nr:hypothetical protein [Chlorobiaceae bacterium]MBA4309241.1 hypothetical protein [Chlorobiaceae bacterium]
MNCPVCDVTLQISNRENIEIDYCPKCRGVWLDRGELDKIIERSVDMEERNSPPPPPPPPNYNHPPPPPPPGQYYRRDDDYYKYKKKKSVLGQLFDF